MSITGKQVATLSTKGLKHNRYKFKSASYGKSIQSSCNCNLNSPVTISTGSVEKPKHASLVEPSGELLDFLCDRRLAFLMAFATSGLTTFVPSSQSITEFDPGFYSDWPYIIPSDILPYIFSEAKQGDVSAMIAAFDKFGEYYPMYKCGDEKGKLLEEVIQETKPKVVLEIGSFLGYSAIRMLRNMKADSKMITIESKSENAEVARQIFSYAGFADKVQILKGKLAKDAIPEVGKLLKGVPVDVVFMDHFKESYLEDLIQMEKLGIVGEGTVLLADNVIYPGAPEFLGYVSTRKGRYETKLLVAKFEYEQKWKPDWTPKADAISVSIFKTYNSVEES